MKKIYLVIVFVLFVIPCISLYNYIFIKNDYYSKIYEDKTNTYVESLSTPRGRILDVNGKVLVDNIGVKTIVYRKIDGITTNEEINISYLLADILQFNKTASVRELKKFWMIKNSDLGKKLITEEEYNLYNQRKLNSSDLYLLKLDRITEEMLEEFSEIDKKAAYVYSLMNQGYSYEAKIIKKDVTDQEYASVLENKIKGVTNEMYF